MTEKEILEIIEMAARDGRTQLNLGGNGIRSLPGEIGKLTNLTTLDLSRNQLTSVPAELGKLTNLNELALDRNQLTSVPVELGNLNNLTTLDLEGNQLASVPAELGNRNNLTTLYLNSNQFTSVPAELGNLTKLTTLYLDSNQLTSVPAELGNLTNLTTLYLNSNQLTSVPAELGKLTKLTYLDLSDNPLEAPLAEVVEQGTEAVLAYLRKELEGQAGEARKSGGVGEAKGEAGTGSGGVRIAWGMAKFERVVGCSLGDGSRRIVRLALELSKKVSPNSPVLSTSWLVLAMVHAGRRAGVRTTEKFFFKRVRETERDVLDSHLAAAKKSRQARGGKSERGVGVTDYVEGTMKRAKEIAQNTTGDEAIQVRHLFAGLLLYTQKGRETGAHGRLREMGVDIEGIKGEFLGFLKEAWAEDNMAAWSRILKGEDVIDSGAVTDSEADVGASIGGYSVPDQPAKIDTLGFDHYTTAIARFLSHEDTRPPLTMSVEGEWGSGKSSFMLQLEEKLREKDGLIVKFSPWRHDEQESLWAAFVLTFIAQLSEKLGWIGATKANLKLLWCRFDFRAGWPEVVKFVLKLWAYLLIFVFVLVVLWLSKISYIGELGVWGKLFLSVVSLVAGAGAVVFKGLKKVKEIVGNPFEQDLKKYIKAPDYEGRIPFIERFHKDFKRIVETYAREKKVYVFIDDLDRCEVPKAANLMRAVNLMISDNPRVVFIMGMDRQKVAAGLAVKDENIIPFLSPELAGEKNDKGKNPYWRSGLKYGYEFIEKFIQLPFSIPRPTGPDIDNMMDSIAGKQGQVREEEVVQEPGKKEIKDSLGAVDSQKERETEGEGNGLNIEEQKEKAKERQRLEMSLADDSKEVRAIVLMVAPALDFNPRRVKQFINLFRLRAYIAYETEQLVSHGDAGRSDRVTLEQLGKIVAITLKWPLFLDSLDQNNRLLWELAKFAEKRTEDMSSLSDWAKDSQLMELIRFGCLDTKGQRSGKWAAYTLVNAKIEKLLEVSPRVRSMEIAPLEVRASDALKVEKEATGESVYSMEIKSVPKLAAELEVERAETAKKPAKKRKKAKKKETKEKKETEKSQVKKKKVKKKKVKKKK